MECNSNYKSHEEEIMKIGIEDNKEHFDSEVTINKEWSKDWSGFDKERCKPYKCTKCTKVFEFNKDLLIHIQLAHEGNRTFECEYCNHSFYKEVELFSHTSLCNFLLGSLHQCSVCFITFSSLKALTSHTKVHKKDKKRVHNPQNHIEIDNETKISKEQKIQKPPTKKIRLAYEEINCPEKDFEVLKVRCLTKDPHDNDEIEIIPMNNKKEHKVEKLKKLITVHMKSVHEQKKSYECMICSEKFAKESQLSKHTCKPYIPELNLIDCPVPSNNEQIFLDEDSEEVYLTKDTHEIDEFDLIPMNNRKDYVQKLTIKKPKPENTIFSDEEIEELPRTEDNQKVNTVSANFNNTRPSLILNN